MVSVSNFVDFFSFDYWHYCCFDLRKAVGGLGSKLFDTVAAVSLVSGCWSSFKAHFIVVEGLH